MKQKCFQITTKQVRRSQQFQLRITPKFFGGAKWQSKVTFTYWTKPLKNPEILKINLRNTRCSSVQNRWSVDLLQRSAFGFAVSLTLIYWPENLIRSHLSPTEPTWTNTREMLENFQQMITDACMHCLSHEQLKKQNRTLVRPIVGGYFKTKIIRGCKTLILRTRNIKYHTWVRPGPSLSARLTCTLTMALTTAKSQCKVSCCS